MSDIAEGTTEVRIPFGGLGAIIDGGVTGASQDQWITDPTGNIARGGRIANKSPLSGGKEKRIAEAGGHVIGSVKFGRDRLTTCEGCDFTATGDTDEAMALAWGKHPPRPSDPSRDPARRRALRRERALRA